MCPRLSKLLGTEMTYLASGEKLITSELSKVGNIIGILFVAGDALNTDKTGKEVKDLRDSLVQFYGIQKKEREASFEVVVILTNLTQQSHEDSAISVRQLFSEQGSPFLSISCEKAMKIQEWLVKKYEVKDIPALVLIEADTTEVITFDGAEKLLQDPTGKEFPWRYPAFSKIMESGMLIKNIDKPNQSSSQEDTVQTREKIAYSHLANPIKGILFAAYWCPPCRSFLATLATLYESVNKEERRFEIVYVSSDRSEESFDRFFAAMPWLAVPFEDERRRELLTKAFNVKAIPTLALVDDKDNVITCDGRLEVNDDVEGIVREIRPRINENEFPWHPRLVDDLREKHAPMLNDSVCVIYFTDDSDSDYDFAENILNPVAEEIDRSSLEDACTPRFFVATDSDLAESLRIFMDLAENRSYLVITDLANFRYASQTIKDSTKPSESSVNEFLSKFQSGQVIYKYIQNRFI